MKLFKGLPLLSITLSIIIRGTESSEHEDTSYKSECYDSSTKLAKKCMPEFTNAAYGLKIIASNTCGLKGPTEYCLQSSMLNSKLGYQQDSPNLEPNLNFEEYIFRNDPRCEVCDDKNANNRHPAEYLNDYNNQGNITWWQSETMHEGVQYPNSVNLTLNLGKSFEINYVQVKFYSPRPESFVIYKKTNELADWQPYQYYSASCERTYGKQRNEVVHSNNEAIALCTDEFSDIAPMSGASVVYGTLENRPSAYNFENSPELNEWVTATDIRISLNRLNTFGDEVFNDPQVLKSYYYAISGIAVGGRCKCHGHASKCSLQQQENFEDRLVCECRHFTTGVNCDQCLPFYNDAPWQPANQNNANECKPCNCNKLSNKCHFNETLFRETGHGGYCDECRGNTEGSNCQTCKFGTYRKEDENTCTDCQCNLYGAESLQCDPFGKCRCRPGVIGEKCDRCAPHHYDLTITGCKLCNCNPIGSFDSPPLCDPYSGFCRCKANVEGQNCDRPKPGFFNLDEENLHGALACFCYGQTSQCNSSTDYFIYDKKISFVGKSIESAENKNRAVDSFGNAVQTFVVTNLDAITVEIGPSHQQEQSEVYFVLPEFVGDQTYSYNQNLTFDLEILDMKEANAKSILPSRKDIIIESASTNLEVYLPIYGGNHHLLGDNKPILPSAHSQKFQFKLNQNNGWLPTLTAFNFQRLLSNISSIKIRASYLPNTRTLLSKISLTSAKPYNQRLTSNVSDLVTAKFVETCSCPTGYTGQHCQSCAYGYRRSPLYGGLFARCIPCTCNNHSNICDPDSGKCDCKHHTNGDNCEKCKKGYYGNALILTEKLSKDPNIKFSDHEVSNVCKKCPCPNNGACAEIFNYQLQSLEVVCLECPYGTQGNLCELCDDGHYQPSPASALQTCQKCSCNGNIDENAIGNCDSQASVEVCLRCIHNTSGQNCENCLPSYWGNALTSKKCHACECFELGTYTDISGVVKQCNLDNGQCECRPNVKNRKCNECKNGFWNILSGQGCEECKCNPLGSFNQTCDFVSGQCFCRPGVQGLKCDTCQPNWYGYSDQGCTKCECNQFGTELNALQCDDTGKCSCRENFAGVKCEKCAENRYNFTSGCLKCDDCYNLVETKVAQLRRYIDTVHLTLERMLEASLNRDDSEIKDENMKLIMKLQSLKLLAEQVHRDLFKSLRPGGYSDSIMFLRDEIRAIGDELKSLDKLYEQFGVKFEQGRKLYELIENSMAIASNQFSFIQKMNEIKANELSEYERSVQGSEQHLELQDLAKKAREMSSAQEKASVEMKEAVSRHISEGRSALERLDGIVKGYDRLETEKELNILELDYEDIKEKLDGMVEEARVQKAVLDERSREANFLIEKLGKFVIPKETLSVSDTLVEENQKIIDNINKQSISMKRDVEELKEKINKFVEGDSMRSTIAAQSQLSSATIKQKDIDYLLEVMLQTKANSEYGVKTATEVYENATKIYEALKSSDQLVLNGKQKVAESQKLVPLIEENLLGSEEANKILQKKLYDLENQIEHVKFLSGESLKNMKYATSTFDSLRKKSVDLMRGLAELDKQVSKLNANITRIKPAAEQAASLYINLASRTDLVQKNAENITLSTQDLYDDANNALGSLININKSISSFSLSSLDRRKIENLEKKFEDISRQLDEETNLDETISDLENYSVLSFKFVMAFESEILTLKEQVMQLYALNRTLKNECYANTLSIPEL